MVIWLGYLAISFIGGVILWRSKSIWKLIGLALIVLAISAFYYIGWKF